MFLSRPSFSVFHYCMSMIKQTINILLKLANLCETRVKCAKTNSLFLIIPMKSSVHLHGTFKDYFNLIKSLNVTQE